MVEAQIYNTKQKTVCQKINRLMILFIIVENKTKSNNTFKVACKCSVMKFKV